MKGLLFAALIGFASVAQANPACDNPKNDFDGLYCLNKIYQEADKELNVNYTKLMQKVDTTGKQSLKEGQLKWIRERNMMCSMTTRERFFVDVDCATQSTIQRSQFLQDRLRECASSGCLNSKLK